VQRTYPQLIEVAALAQLVQERLQLSSLLSKQGM
jgi:hypothetical protein